MFHITNYRHLVSCYMNLNVGLKINQTKTERFQTSELVPV